jgi:1-acyl-sn-glycerol-3-phosphate acyltransferase
MIWTRIKGIKRFFIQISKGEEEAWRYGQKVFKVWTLFTVKFAGMKITVSGKENIPSGTCVFMGNHQSILDIPVLKYATDINLDFVAKDDLLKIPVVRYWIPRLKTIILNRENAREGVKSINLAIENVKLGYSYVIFPEGTRSKDNKVHEFKKGSLKIATKSKVPIVPFAINGTDSFLGDGKKLKPGNVGIIFGKPIETSDLSKDDEKALAEQLQNTVLKLYEEIKL